MAFSHEFVWSALLGALVALHLIGVGRLFASAPVERAVELPIVGWLAGGSFSLYLVHYPLLHFVAALLPGDVHAFGRQAALLLAVCLSCLGFAAVFERTLAAQRAFLQRLARSVREPRRAGEGVPELPPR